MSNDDELKGQSSVAGTPVLTKRNGIISTEHYIGHFVICTSYNERISAVHDKCIVFQVA